MTSLNIGLVAYHAVGNLCFVRVPSERGRYMLTDLCVIAVPCPLCGALVGEPCRSGSWSNGQPVPHWRVTDRNSGHGCSVHCARKIAADTKLGRGWKKRLVQHYRLHLSAGDITAAMMDAPVPDPEPEPYECDVIVTPRVTVKPRNPL